MNTALLVILAATILPTALYVLVFYWADRYEREPLWLLIVAFVWGALPAAAVSLIGETVLELSFVRAPNAVANNLLQAVVVAPVVEEVAKGLVLVAIYVLLHREFDGLLDGLTYGALVGFGFAMTENFFFFTGAFRSGGYAQLSLIIVVRAVIFGLNHALYTSFIGLGLGLARQARRRWPQIAWPLLGLALAMLIHALHNLGVALTQVGVIGLVVSLATGAASLGVVIAAMGLAWSQERGVLRAELAEEVGRTISAAEYAALLGRWRSPIQWTVRRGTQRQKEHTRARHQLAVELALHKHAFRQRDARADPGLLGEIVAMRDELVRSWPASAG